IPEGQKPINSARASYAARPCRGGERIVSGWEKIGDKTVYTFVIPDGMSATVSLLSRGELNVNGLAMTEEDLCASRAGGRVSFELSGGTYTVETR
ncbi:MAG: hypothetical protein MJ137_07635, partial [Clostridia bacterium]|nr:hypothetical protein [Clostridia bacterium]